jgi:HAD superfamily hydrolase (TIGR01509 family)
MIRAIIFDLDGTLADTETLHFEAFRESLAPEGIHLGRDEYFERLIGFTDQDLFATVLADRARTSHAATLARLMGTKAAFYQSRITGRDVLYPGAADFVRRCAERFPLIIATGTIKAEAELILSRGQIRDLFLDIIAAEDVAHGKPEPDGFLAALGRLGFLMRPRPSIAAAECLAIEDTAAGITAARRAGMRVMGIGQTAPEGELIGADLLRPSLRETDLDEILRLLASR